jgi:hypothetical protein
MKPVQDEQLAREELALQGAQLAREMLALLTSLLRQRAKMSQEGLTDVQIQQLRYSLMMTELARFFRDVSLADDLANEFANLSRIFLGLTEGVSHPIVKPSIPATSNDRPDVWSARSKAALAMECLLLCKTRKVAAKFAAKNAPGLELLITRRRGDKVVEHPIPPTKSTAVRNIRARLQRPDLPSDHLPVSRWAARRNLHQQRQGRLA